MHCATLDSLQSMPNIKKKRKRRGGKEGDWDEGGREEGRKKLRKHKNTKEEKKKKKRRIKIIHRAQKEPATHPCKLDTEDVFTK